MSGPVDPRASPAERRPAFDGPSARSALRAGEAVCYRGLIMAEREPAGPFCFECVWFPEAPADLEESAPDRAAGRSLTADFVCPRIRRRVVPTYAAHCPDYQEPVGES